MVYKKVTTIGLLYFADKFCLGFWYFYIPMQE